MTGLGRYRWAVLVVGMALIASGWLVQRAWREEAVDVRTMAENAKVKSNDGTMIAYSKLGQGPPLILVDGAFCFRGNGPTPQLAPLLAEQFTVYAYDRRGRAESGNVLPYAVQREVEDLQALIEISGGSAFVFGMSSGGGLVLRAAEASRGIRKLALYEPPYITDKDGRLRPLAREQADLQGLVAAGKRSDAVMYFMTEVFGAPRLFIHGMRIVMRPTWRKNESVAHTLPYDLAILTDDSVLKSARGIKVPALIIGGSESSAEIQQAVNTVGDAVPHAQQRMLEGQTHNVSMEVLAPVLTEFFAAK